MKGKIRIDNILTLLLTLLFAILTIISIVTGLKYNLDIYDIIILYFNLTMFIICDIRLTNIINRL